MRRIGVAGGIGAGKSVVTARLSDLGWTVVDADAIAHQVTARGTDAWRALRDAFGEAVLTPVGEIDRPFLADVVFHDASARARLNRITHLPIGLEMRRQLEAAEGRAVFAALPLFRPEHRELLGLASVWAVQASPEIALERLCASRGYREEDARARMASQMTNEERAAIVDRVIWNEGTLDELYARVDEALAAEGLAGG
ncbi:MAG: dephospho-CoA kinase [Acidimicrobiales bacterium]